MDGTLLNTDSRVSRTSASIISDLSRRGALITVATARTPATVVPLLADTLTNPPAIVMTGAAMWFRSEERYDAVKEIPHRLLGRITDACGETGLHPFVYIREGLSHLAVYHAGSHLSAVEEEFYKSRANLPLKHFMLRSSIPSGEDAILCYAMGHHEAVFAAAAALKEQDGLALSCYYDIFDRNTAHLEIFAAGVSKASAVLDLKQRIGADRLVVFGDNLNDLPMMAVADCAVAVGNAFEEVKTAADIVIGPNTSDSVAHFILRDFEGR